MAFDYAEAAAKALELIAEFGIEVSHSSVPDGTYNVATSTMTAVPVQQTGTGVLLEYSTQEKGVRQAAGKLVQTNDRKLLLAPQGITIHPVPNDTITFNAITYTVIEVATLGPAGIPVLFTLQVRR